MTNDAASPGSPPPTSTDPTGADAVVLDRIRAGIAGCGAAHARLIEGLSGLDDETARRPSALPGWSVGHVLTHLARNADSHVRMAQGVLAGEVWDQYAGGSAEREAAIEAGAGRPAAALVADVAASIAALAQLWDRVPADRWLTGAARGVASGEFPARLLPAGRWREVEMHRADLGLASFAWQDWSDAFVRAELPFLLKRLAATSGQVPVEVARHLAAVLAGRADGPVAVPSLHL